MTSDLLTVYLKPGEIRIARRPTILQTILGSCVGVTFWSPRVGIGALCHGVLPRCPAEWPPEARAGDGYRYVDFAIRHVAERFDSLGISRWECQIKVFGGADVLPVSRLASRSSIGNLNCQAASEVLEQEGFTVLASDLRGNRGRNIRFHTGSGDVEVRRMAVRLDPSL